MRDKKLQMTLKDGRKNNDLWLNRLDIDFS